MKKGDVRVENQYLEGQGIYLLLRPGYKTRKLGDNVKTWIVLVLDDETWTPGIELELSQEWLGNATEKFKA